MNNIIFFFCLLLISGCSNDSNFLSQQEYNSLYKLRYSIVIEGELATLYFSNENNEVISEVTLPNTDDYLEQKALSDFCQQDIECLGQRGSASFISWSPDQEYLAIFTGPYSGFWFISSQQIISGSVTSNSTIQVGLHQSTSRLKIALFHKLGGWVDEHSYIFSAGLSGKDLVYKFDPKIKQLKGFPFELNQNSTVTTFIPVFVNAFQTKKNSLNLELLTEQITQLK